MSEYTEHAEKLSQIRELENTLVDIKDKIFELKHGGMKYFHPTLVGKIQLLEKPFKGINFVRVVEKDVYDWGNIITTELGDLSEKGKKIRSQIVSLKHELAMYVQNEKKKRKRNTNEKNEKNENILRPQLKKHMLPKKPKNVTGKKKTFGGRFSVLEVY